MRAIDALIMDPAPRVLPALRVASALRSWDRRSCRFRSAAIRPRASEAHGGPSSSSIIQAIALPQGRDKADAETSACGSNPLE